MSVEAEKEMQVKVLHHCEYQACSIELECGTYLGHNMTHFLRS
jgi:hypothetical protein